MGLHDQKIDGVPQFVSYFVRPEQRPSRCFRYI